MMFRFTIRDVLWLTVVMALMLGWGLDHSRQAIREAMRLAAESESLRRELQNAEMELAKAKSKELGAPQAIKMRSTDNHQ